MDKNDVTGKIAECVDRLYENEKALFERNLCERCLMFRLAYYLQKEFPDHFVDCEFNKVLVSDSNTDKMIFGELDKRIGKMYTDIVVHKRDSNGKGNLVCMEIKRTKKGIESDIERLKMMTSNSGIEYMGKRYIYAYDYGFFIYLSHDKYKHVVRLFNKGLEL
jgi:hypothetical protein